MRCGRTRKDSVYPRVCGGTSASPPSTGSIRGLSPRVRGNRRRCARLGGRVRSIPACAGEPAGGNRGRAVDEVYPRVCGGTSFRVRYPCAPSGLSPRVRGNHILDRCDDVIQRSIPACAGEPAGGNRGRAVDEVYPRVCGGTPKVYFPLLGIGGLSPRVRGNPGRGKEQRAHPRSIPACAGEPVGLLRTARRRRSSRPGLSPRVRGNRTTARRLDGHGRSIPACAGEPGSDARRKVLRRVYPRVCGGTGLLADLLPILQGLSPRVRGNPQEASTRQQGERSIPACAGEPRNPRVHV